MRNTAEDQTLQDFVQLSSGGVWDRSWRPGAPSERSNKVRTQTPEPRRDERPARAAFGLSSSASFNPLGRTLQPPAPAFQRRFQTPGTRTRLQRIPSESCSLQEAGVSDKDSSELLNSFQIPAAHLQVLYSRKLEYIPEFLSSYRHVAPRGFSAAASGRVWVRRNVKECY